MNLLVQNRNPPEPSYYVQGHLISASISALNDAKHQQDSWIPHALELWQSLDQMSVMWDWNQTSCQRTAGKFQHLVFYIKENEELYILSSKSPSNLSMYNKEIQFVPRQNKTEFVCNYKIASMVIIGWYEFLPYTILIMGQK